MRRCVALSAVLLALAWPRLLAQQTPVFRSGTNLVQVDAIITDGEGAPILDLTADDFTLLDDGKPMPIQSVRLLGASSAELEGPLAPIRTVEDEEREASREGVRVFAILLDDYHVQRFHELRIIPALLAFVRELPKTDLVGVYGLFDSIQDARLTRDREPAIKAISAFYGRMNDFTPKFPFEDEQLRHPREAPRIRADITRGALSGIATHLGGLTEGRKTIVFVSEGFSIEEFDLRELTENANRANVALYPLDANGLTGVARGLYSPQEVLRRLAFDTGGAAIVNTNNFRGALDRVARDSSAYYLLAYESPHPDDGKFHNITVRVKRPRVTVRARSGYRAFKSPQTSEASLAMEVAPAVTSALARLADSVRPDPAEPVERPRRMMPGTVIVAPPPELMAAPTLAIARGRTVGSAVERREFVRQTELVARVVTAGGPKVTARLLDRHGLPLTELPVTALTDQCDVRFALGNLGLGDYVIEFTATAGDRQVRQFVAFRVVP